MRGIEQLIRRAKASGQLRPDFAFEDLSLVLMANSGVVDRSPGNAIAASRRLIGYLLDTFRTDAVPVSHCPRLSR
jgi:hypothetical protein